MERLPKYVYYDKRTNKYLVQVPIKGQNNNHYVGRFASVAASVVARDAFLKGLNEDRNVTQNPSKGISLHKKSGKYRAGLQFLHRKKHISLYIGLYDTSDEAVQARLQFIENLK